MAPEHDLELALMRLAWRLDALDEWRTKVDERQGALEHELQGLVKADDIAEAVAAKVNQQHTLALTRVQRLGAVIVAMCAIGSLLIQVVRM